MAGEGGRQQRTEGLQDTCQLPEYVPGHFARPQRATQTVGTSAPRLHYMLLIVVRRLHVFIGLVQDHP